MKKASIYLTITSLVLVLASLIMVGITYGWFTIQYTIPNGQVGAGELKYIPAGAFIPDASILVPGEELVDTAFEVTNSSTIDSQLRIQIIYTKVINDNNVISSSNQIYHNDIDDHINVTMNGSFVLSGDYFYYGGDTSVIPLGSGLISLVTSLYYDGEFTGIDYSSETVHVTLIVQAKQADNVTWTQLINYDFETGNPL